MNYVTGMHALNLMCPLGTTGDWHSASVDWNNLEFKESEDSVFGDFGIYEGKILGKKYHIADHIRASLDFLEDGKFMLAGGMRKDYLDDDPKFDEIVFEKCLLLKDSELWDKIDAFLSKEYKSRYWKWRDKNGLGKTRCND